jgi:hypothetical protein
VSGVVIGCILVLGGALAIGAAGKTPPTIDEIDGTSWEVTFNGTDVDAQTGFETKFKLEGTWTITKLSDLTVQVHQEIGAQVLDYKAAYLNGHLWLGRASNDDLAEVAIVGALEVSGKLGKLKLSGSSQSYVVFVISDAKIKAKQVAGL